MRKFTLCLIAIVITIPNFAWAWNALGHKVVCEIAWQQLSEARRKEIVDVLQRHPRFGEDFVSKMPDVDPADQWIFQHAGTWPDLARGIRGPEREKYDKPIWHYVNFPLTIDGFPAPKKNLSRNPEDNKSIAWNVLQATEHCLAVVRSDAPPSQRAIAYSWLFHLVGDLHQPLHSTALFCERFPSGDRGGNSIKLAKGDNLHSLWDNLLGRAHQLNDVRREVAQLKRHPELWKVDTSGTLADWTAESHELAKGFAYSPDVLDAIRQPDSLLPLQLPESYYREAGEHARARIVAAGLRLAVLLGGSGELGETEIESTLAYWLNTNSNVRHNSTCKHFQKTKGRSCTADEGKPCGICGG
jgi:hypothetical protein